MIPPIPGSIFAGLFILHLFRFTNSNHLWNVHPTSPLFIIVCNSLYSCVYDIINLFIIIYRFLTVTHGQRGNFSISLPVSGLPFLLFGHDSAHVPLPGSYIKGEWGDLLFTSSLLPLSPPLLHSLHSIAHLLSPRAQIVDAREALSAETQDDQGDERLDQLGAFCLHVEGSEQGSNGGSHLQ
jgi:hypothetical protein